MPSSQDPQIFLSQVGSIEVSIEVSIDLSIDLSIDSIDLIDSV